MGDSNQNKNIKQDDTTTRVLNNSDQAAVKTQGVFNSPIVEANPKYIEAPGDVVHANKHNAWIVLGRDRNATLASGKGGRGDSQTGAIDLVVGRMASNPDSEKYVDPNFQVDSARVYISQKADIDEYLNLSDGTVGNTKDKSAIGIKADAVRIVGREGVKIVTTTDKFNSQKGELVSYAPINLIAGNNDSGLQPLVKGENLIKALSEIYNRIDELATTVSEIQEAQQDYNTTLANHSHRVVTGWSAGTAFPSTSLAIDLASYSASTAITAIDLSLISTNIGINKAKAIEVRDPKTYINSQWNSTN